MIAEAGVNHNGDPALAHQLIDAAADAGADAVKFQTFDPAMLVSVAADTAPYQRAQTDVSSQRAMLDALVLPESEWERLAGHARDRGVTFLSTAFDLDSLDILQALAVPVLKVPSGELTNLAFIRALADRGLPLIMSTGMGDLAEVGAAVEAAAAAPGLCLLHCVTAYPTPVDESNLRALVTMREHFGLAVGWSDHTDGSATAIAAIALGARLLEKHLTLDRSLPGPDHAASASPEEFASYVRAVRETESALGDGIKQPAPSERENRVAARRSLHTTRELPAGHLLTDEDVVSLRPALGLVPSTSLGQLRTRRAMPAGAVLMADDVDHSSVET